MFQQDQQGCPVNGTTIEQLFDINIIPTVDLSYQDCDDVNSPNYRPRLTPLVPCKNNCRGVAGVTIVAGGAALVAATTLAATSFSPVLSLIIGEINININMNKKLRIIKIIKTIKTIRD